LISGLISAFDCQSNDSVIKTMAFNNIDAPGEGNRRARRAVAVIQRKAGADGRLAAAQAKRQRKMARSFERDLDRTIVFYAMPLGGVSARDPDGAYLNPTPVLDLIQVVIAGPLKASIDHYVKAVGAFLKVPMRFASTEELPLAPNAVSDRVFISLIVEPVNEPA
jgi:hypothetical protein